MEEISIGREEYYNILERGGELMAENQEARDRITALQREVFRLRGENQSLRSRLARIRVESSEYTGEPEYEDRQ